MANQVDSLDMNESLLSTARRLAFNMQQKTKDTKPSESEKWGRKVQAYDAAMKERNELINFLKTNPKQGGNLPAKDYSYFELWNMGQENMLTINQIKAKIDEKKFDMTNPLNLSSDEQDALDKATENEHETNANGINAKRNPLEVLKDNSKSWMKGDNKHVPGVIKALLGFSVVDVAAKLITGNNAWNLLKLGVGKIPGILPTIGSAISTAWAACPAAIVTAGAAGLLFAAPLVKQLIEKGVKAAGGNEAQFNEEVNKLAQKQAQQQP